MVLKDAFFLTVAVLWGIIFGYNLHLLRRARAGLMVKFPQPNESSDWKPEDIAGAIIMFSKPVLYMGIEWYDRFGDVIYTESLKFSDAMKEEK